MWILLVTTIGTMYAPPNIKTIEFKTENACKQAEVFFTRNPHPTHNSIAKCIFDEK